MSTRHEAVRAYNISDSDALYPAIELFLKRKRAREECEHREHEIKAEILSIWPEGYKKIHFTKNLNVTVTKSEQSRSSINRDLLFKALEKRGFDHVSIAALLEEVTKQSEPFTVLTVTADKNLAKELSPIKFVVVGVE